MRRFTQFALLAGALAFSAMSADAATITSYATITPQTAPFTQTVSLNKFNTVNGTLQSVTLSILANGQETVKVVNLNTTPQQYTNARASTTVTVTGPGAVTASTTLDAGPFSGTVPAATVFNIPNFGPVIVPGQVSNTGPGTSVTGTGNVAPAAFSLYEGSGAQQVTFSVGSNAGNYSGNGPAGVFFGGSAVVGATVAVTYTYTAIVPEPTTLAALASGLVCVGLVRLRRKSA